MEHVRDSTKNLQLLAELLLASPVSSETSAKLNTVERLNDGDLSRTRQLVSDLGQRDLEDLKALAITHHVIVRAFARLQQILEASGKGECAEWVAGAVQQETVRISHALGFLEQICADLEDDGCPVTVIKSLDHWPDLGSDLDLYTDADAANVVAVMSARFQAKLADRSWVDRRANKWNFIVPGLSELVEVHSKRLGQTGEQTFVTRSLSARARRTQVRGHLFRVPAPEDRIVISTLQRMNRHFYIRLCDIADNAQLLDSHLVNFDYLHSLGSAAGVWEGIATYLTIISEYVAAYRGSGVPLPAIVTESAKFGTDRVRFRRDFLSLDPASFPESVCVRAS